MTYLKISHHDGVNNVVVVVVIDLLVLDAAFEKLSSACPIIARKFLLTQTKTVDIQHR